MPAVVDRPTTARHPPREICRRRRRKKWHLDTSCWAPRKESGNSGDFFETSEAMRRMPRNPGQAGVISIRSTWNNTIVNVADDEPTPSAELLEFAAELIGCNLPAEESYADASQTMSAMAQSFWSENRRVSNRLLCKELGYTLLHPNYRSGLRDCLKQEHHQNV